jgi:predicted DNA-binding transcriptional regulator AlpA
MKHSRPMPAPSEGPAMIDARKASQLIGVSPATWFRMVAAGRTPAPIQVSAGCVRYRMADLLLWIEAGCPRRSEFEGLSNN